MEHSPDALTRVSAERKVDCSHARRLARIRSELRLADLKAHVGDVGSIDECEDPTDVSAAIAAHVKASKTDLVIALLNEGLQAPAIRARWNPEVRS